MKIHRLILDNLTELEVLSLARDLNVDYSKLPGHGYGAKTRALIMHLKRRGRLNEADG